MSVLAPAFFEPSADCFWIDDETEGTREVVHSIAGVWDRVLAASESLDEYLDLKVWMVRGGIPGEVISARILPDRPFRVVGCCLANGYGFWVDSFASRKEAEQEIESWPEGEFSLSLIVEAS